VQSHREIEDKYDLQPDTELPRLDGLPGVASVRSSREQRLEATYFDTQDLRLAASGITLRRRKGGEDAGWHLKLPADGARYEVTEPLRRARRSVPKRLRELLRTVARGQTLSPVAILRTRRTSHRLLDDQGRVLAEVADDRVTSEVRSDPTPDVSAWREVEVELDAGGEELRSAASDLLRESGAEPSQAVSKLARSLGDRIPGPRFLPARSAKDPAAAVVHARLAKQVDELRRRDPAVRADLPDAVHTMRVATRRLRSALATYRPFLCRDVTEPIRDELGWLADVLGAARDPEVHGGRLVERMDEVTDAADETAQARVETYFEERYDGAHQRCLEVLEAERYLALLAQLDHLVERPPWTASALEPVDEVLTKRVRHDWKRVRRRAASARDADPGVRASRLHEVRKAVKRVRYAAEPLVPVYGKKAKRLVKAMKNVQDVLGDHHDTVTARAQLQDLASNATGEGENAFPYGVLHAREADAALRLEDEFERTWAKASKKSLRRWLS